MAEADPRLYHRQDVIAFRKTNEPFGGLSNMAPGFPVKILDVRIATVEALYQACRFPHLPQVQQLIISETSPMTAKMRSKPYRKDSRPDWDGVRVPIMKWCLRVKLLQNWDKFSALLLETGDRPIVEDSRKDDFWGAMPNDDGTLRGRNVLGRLLMELREKLRTGPAGLELIRPLPIADFLLFSQPIPELSRPTAVPTPSTVKRHPIQPSMLDPEFDAREDTAATLPPASLRPVGTQLPVRVPISVETPAAAAMEPAQEELRIRRPSSRRRAVLWVGAGFVFIAFVVYLLTS